MAIKESGYKYFIVKEIRRNCFPVLVGQLKVANGMKNSINPVFTAAAVQFLSNSFRTKNAERVVSVLALQGKQIIEKSWYKQNKYQDQYFFY